jgi:hypothetical protein
MGMTIDDVIKCLPAPMSSGSTIIYPEEQKYYEAHDTAVNILRKYQKIKEIVKNSNGLLLDGTLEGTLEHEKAFVKIREVIEDGNDG